MRKEAPVVFFLLVSLTASLPLHAGRSGRYFYEGDGKIDLSGRRGTLEVTYRLNDGTYSTSALKKIDAFFGIPGAGLREGISLRLIAMIDYLQDKFVPGKTVTLRSGYRSPEYNTSLRKKGKLAAKTSYHMEGMAADLIFPAVKPEVIWEYVRSLDCCGIGIYGGKEVHLDSGKPRFWTAETALPKEDVPPLNRNIYLAADKDIYYPGETLRLFFSGVSDYPFGVKIPFKLKKGDRTIESFAPEFKKEISGAECVLLEERKQVRLITWKIPEDLKAPDGKLSVEVEFCDPMTGMMPPRVDSKAFVIKTATTHRFSQLLPIP